MTHHEHFLPPGIVNIDEVMGGITMKAVFEYPDRSPSISEESEQLLHGLLNDPFALNNPNHEKSRAAGFIWRLGAAHNLTRLVLSHVHDVMSIDEDLGSFFPGREAVAEELLKHDPQLLQNIESRDEAAFWQLVGCDFSEEMPPGAMAGVLLLLAQASYIPEHTLEDIRVHRDSTANMRHEPMISLATDGVNIVKEVEELDERERDLVEAGVRVICGAFVARYSEENDDQRTFRHALADFSDRAFVDSVGLQHALHLAHNLVRLSDYGQGQNSPVLQLFARRLEHFAAEIEVDSIAFDQLCDMVDVAHFVHQLGNVARLEDFVTRGAAVLAGFQALSSMVTDPSSEVAATDSKARLAQMLSSGKSRMAADAADSLLGELRGEMPVKPSADTTMGLLRTEGYNQAYVTAAVRHIASELDPRKRKVLSETFDRIIGEVLESLPDDHALRQQNGLQTLDAHHLGVGYLAYFKAGRAFIDSKMHDYLGGISACLARPEAWQSKRPDYAVATWLKTVHDALWYNRYYYVQTGNYTRIMHQVTAVTDEAMDFMESKGLSPGTINIMQELAAGFSAFDVWLDESPPDPQDVVAQDPIYTILSKYKGQPL